MSSNLLCDPSIWQWFYGVHPGCSNKPIFNESDCTLTYYYQDEDECLARPYIPSTSVFSNETNYPINFTVRGIAMGNASAYTPYSGNFGIILAFDNRTFFGGQIPTNMKPTEITFQFMSPYSSGYTCYKNGKVDFKSNFTVMGYHGNNSMIKQIGPSVGPSTADKITIFDAYFVCRHGINFDCIQIYIFLEQSILP